jgi:hypothetical protein
MKRNIKKNPGDFAPGFFFLPIGGLFMPQP